MTSPFTVQFLVAMLAYGFNERMARKAEYLTIQIYEALSHRAVVLLATRLRYQRSRVSGVTMQAIPLSPARPRALARTANLRRCSLVRRKRFFPSCSRGTRFSSMR